MALPAYPTEGTFVLDGVSTLPNISIAYPGESYTDCTASGSIVPGEAVVRTASAGAAVVAIVPAGASANPGRVGVAMREEDPPDPDRGPTSLGPNQVSNKAIAQGEYVQQYMTGDFNLTLVVPAVYAPGDLVGWDLDGARPTGKTGTGAWAASSASDIPDIFEVVRWQKVNDDNEGILTVRFLGRGNV